MMLSRPVALTALIAAAFAAPAMAGGTEAATQPKPGLTSQLIVKYKEGMQRGASATRPHAANSLRAMGFSAQNVRVTNDGAQIVQLDQAVSAEEAARLAQALEASDASIEYAEPDLVMKPMFWPNDKFFNQQWHYFEEVAGMNLNEAWDKSTGSGVTVAVLDTGYRPHADLAANIVGGYDFVSDKFMGNDGDGRDADAKDPGDGAKAGECSFFQFEDEPSSWHGTHVAGTIAAVANNKIGVAGVAFNAKILPVRVLGKCGGMTSDIADAIVWAAGGTVANVPKNPNPAKVINLSLGSGLPSACGRTTQDAINKAYALGAVVVVAAGNSRALADRYSLANCQNVVVVGAVDRTGSRSFYSNYGTVVDVSAPGGDMRSNSSNGVLSTLNNGMFDPDQDSYDYYQGTSMAAPHVAGVVALIRSKFPNLNPEQVEDRLKATTRPFPLPCDGCGTGLVDAARAVSSNIFVWPGTPEVEPNNDIASAQNIVQRKTKVSATLLSDTDVDFYQIKLPGLATLSAKLTPNDRSDYDLVLFDAAGKRIGESNIGADGKNELVQVRNSSTVTTNYYVQVVYRSGGTGINGGRYQMDFAW
ncbi:S8 family peptidase [Chitinimonas lacunae]|uniref:S8 family peptidase n=1 Tax=Chitinimonas lacunae TaxID=1963018 RepID=A0ABV8MUK3_9NEIS